MTIAQLRKKIWNYYKKYGRKMPWRETTDPYHIFVSEVMLQQTQVSRVMQKYPKFIAAFPHFKELAKAPLKKVLRVWAGMGYNRRALYLQKSAQRIMQEYEGIMPRDIDVLESLPGIGPATARSIAAFAFNEPHAFIETNIRSVFIHEFFPHRTNITDREIMPLVKKTLSFGGQAREWHYALMDYGAMLKKKKENPSRKSAHHTKQKKFKGSNRELRGKMVRALIKNPYTFLDLVKKINALPQQVEYNLNALQNEGLLRKQKGKFIIA